MKDFKPMLADNKQPDIETLKFPQLISQKMDGIRIIFLKGQIVTRSLKPLPNLQLNQRFEPIRKYSEEHNLILDGEIYSHNLKFQEIISFCMTDDLNSPKVNKAGIKDLPEHLKFYCFDLIGSDNYDLDFRKRSQCVEKVAELFPVIMEFVFQYEIQNSDDLFAFFHGALEAGFEGAILKNPNGRYKCGRTTLKENLMYKLKPYTTFDAKIIDVVQSTEVNEEAEKKTNELGRSVTSKKKDDRHLIEKASAFVVKYGSEEVKPVLAMTDEEKIEVWKNRQSYIGRTIEYKGMLIGAKDVPRHPGFLRFIDPGTK